MLALLLVAMTASGTGGCASIIGRTSAHQTDRASTDQELNQRYDYYGGTRFDAGCVAYSPSQLTDANGAVVSVPALTLCLVDLPFSAVADTLLLPAD
jgi:uncharacterized protein YceK